MLDMTGIQNTLLEWIGEQTALVLVWPGVNGESVPETGAYLHVRMTSLAKIGEDTLVFPATPDPENPGLFALIGTRELTLAIQGVRAGSLAALEDLRTSLDLPKVREWMQNAETDSDEYTAYVSLAWVDGQPVRNLNGLADVSEDERWLLELRFRTHSEVLPETGIDVIESVEGEGSVDPDGSDLSIQLNAAVPEEEEP